MEEVEREAPPAEPASSGVTSQPVDDDSLQDVDDEEFKDAADGNHCNYIMRPCNILKPSNSTSGFPQLPYMLVWP